MPSSTALYSVSEIRAIEHAALSTLPPGTLMQRAGLAAANSALKLLAGHRPDAAVLVLAGPGNNGGDALEAARVLAEAGLRTTVLLFADEVNQPPDARAALARARGGRVRFAAPTPEVARAPSTWDLVIDGLFGIGLARAISGDMRNIVETVNTVSCPVLALDVPSGLDADTGQVIGEEGIAVRATHTVTFIGNKPGLHTGDGRDYAGEVLVADLEIDSSHFSPPGAHLNIPDAFASFLRQRPHNSHKGSYGDLIVIGGARGMAGAPILAARAAAKCGAGRVYAAFVDDAPAYDSVQPELMCRLAHEMDFSTGTLVVGPGLGTSRAAYDMLTRALHADSPLVLDADALNLIAAEPGLQQMLARRRNSSMMTPHPLEAARLLGGSTRQVQCDRLAAARQLARQFNAVVVLKGSGSIIAGPDGTLMVNTTGNPALATAGTGDVLAGICGALLGQSFPAWNAALAATWLHGTAADILTAQGEGPIGLTASELIPCVRVTLNQLTRQYGQRRATREAAQSIHMTP